eukprot:SAG31_NODE_2221_length_6156_cov_5.333994_2_plen_113_part_00
MYANCELFCRRCVDHTEFLLSGNITHLKSKKAVKVNRCSRSLRAALRVSLNSSHSVQAFAKLDEKALVMFTHALFCKECTYAKVRRAPVALYGEPFRPRALAALPSACVKFN